MNDGWDGARRIIGPRALDEMEVRGNHLFSVGVPIDADPEFKAFVFAAAVAHVSGNTWIDSTLRREKDRLIESFSAPPTTRAARRAALLREIRLCAATRVEQLSRLVLHAEPEGLRSAANHLIRLESTFRAASQLIRLGFAFESEAVIRLGFEQVAWAHAVADATTPEQVEGTRIEHTANRLKPLLPHAGRIYGRLSDLAHMNPNTHERYAGEPYGTRPTVGIQLPEAALESVELLIELLDAFLVISDARFARVGIESTSYDATTAQLIADRPAQRLNAELGAIRAQPVAVADSGLD